MTTGLLLAIGLVLLGFEPAGFGLGLVYEDLRGAPGVREVVSVPVAPGRPSADAARRVDLTEGIPPVGNQGRQGSCVAWAHGYYLKTQFEYVEHGWDVNRPEHQFSPAFLYNQINGGVDGGTGGSRAMALMAEAGCANMVDFPYNQDDFTSWPSETAYRNAMSFRAGYPSYIWAGDTSGINRVRQHLANGYACVLGIQVWSNFDNIHQFRYTYCSSERYGTMRGWHAVTIVGYDDTLSTSDGPGAFRVVNSWGTGWGDRGYFWMSYVAVMDEQMSGRQAEFAEDRLAYEPVLVGWARIGHASRECLGLRLGVGTSRMSLWHHDFRVWRYPRAHVAFPGHLIGFDLTDGASALRGEPTDSLYLEVIDDYLDGREGFIEEFSAEHLLWGTQGHSPDPPIYIPDQGISVWAVLHLAQTGIAETTGVEPWMASRPSVVRGVFRLNDYYHESGGGTQPALLDAAGRRVMKLRPGDNDVTHLAPGVYFVRTAQAQAVRRVVVLK